MNAQAHAGAMTVSAAAPSISEQYLTFVLGEELFAMPILAVQEIRGWERVSAIPKTPAHVLGVINLRGTVVPVLDVRARLGMPSREVTPTTVVIVVRIRVPSGETTVGCVVDAVSDVVNVDPSAVGPAPDICGDIDRHYVRGVTTVEKRLLMLLDLQGLVDGSVSASLS